MNEIVNRILLSRDKFMPEMHLSVKKRKKFKEKAKKKYKNSRKQEIHYIFVCFQHHMAYGDFKDLSRRAVSDKLLHDKGFNIAENLKYDGFQSGLAPMVYKFFDKKSSGANISGGAVKIKIMAKQQLAKELNKPIIRKFEKKKVNSSFIDNILAFDTTDMQLISNKRICFSLCPVDNFGKYT